MRSSLMSCFFLGLSKFSKMNLMGFFTTSCEVTRKNKTRLSPPEALLQIGPLHLFLFCFFIQDNTGYHRSFFAVLIFCKPFLRLSFLKRCHYLVIRWSADGLEKMMNCCTKMQETVYRNNIMKQLNLNTTFQLISHLTHNGNWLKFLF